MTKRENQMKAIPMIVKEGDLVECSVEESTHLKINIPGPSGMLVLPVIRSGTRDETPCWTWNGDTARPTLRPSLLTRMEWKEPPVVCHSFVNDGFVEFLSDSTHSFAGQTVPLIDV